MKQGAIPTQQDILLYQQPYPDQPFISNQKPFNPHPELDPLLAPSMQTSIFEDADGNLDGAEDNRLTLFIASSSIIILALITIVGMVSCFILCNDEPEFSEMVVAAANLVKNHELDGGVIDIDYFESDRRKNRHEDDIISMTQECTADGMLKNVYEESDKGSSYEEEPDERQMKMAASAANVALQLTVGNIAKFERTLSNKNINAREERGELPWAQPRWHNRSQLNIHTSRGETHGTLSSHNRYHDTHEGGNTGSCHDGNSTNMYTSDKPSMHYEIQNLHHNEKKYDTLDGLATSKAKLSELRSSTISGQTKERCDLTSDIVIPSLPTRNISAKRSAKSRGSRRSGQGNPPPRPPRQKQQFPSNALQKEQKFNNEPKNIINDTDYGSFGRGENIGALVQSIMSPLSSCPNIYGNASKKQINASQNHPDDTNKSVSLITSVTNLLERKDLSQIPNPRKILQSSLDKHTSSNNLISVVSPLVPNENQVDTQAPYANNKVSTALGSTHPSTLVEMESDVSAAEARTVTTVPMQVSNEVHDVTSGAWAPNQQPCHSKCHSADRTDLYLEGIQRQPSKETLQHQGQRSRKAQLEETRTPAISSHSPCSSAHSGVYQKCKLCDKCSQRYQHSNKAVGTRGEDTLI